MARSLSPIGVQQDLSGRIFDIQSYSVHDGPGCRTLVFWDAPGTALSPVDAFHYTK